MHVQLTSGGADDLLSKQAVARCYALMMVDPLLNLYFSTLTKQGMVKS